jgi:hypothetical protein
MSCITVARSLDTLIASPRAGHTHSASGIRAAGAPPNTELGLAHLPPAITARLGARLEHATVTATAGELPLALTAPPSLTPTRDELIAALTRYGGSVARVAEHFAKDRQQVYRWARRYGIELASFRDDESVRGGVARVSRRRVTPRA